MKNSMITLATLVAICATTFGGIIDAPAHALSNSPKATAGNSKKVSLYNTSPEFLAKIKVYFDNKDFKGLQELCTKTLESNNRNADAYYIRALCTYVLDGGADAILGDLSAAITLQPGYSDALKARATIYAAVKQHGHAVDDLSVVLALEPQNVDVIIALVNNHYEMCDYQGMIEDCTYWISICPEEPNAYYIRALSYIDMNNQIAARADLEKAAQLFTAQNRLEEAEKVQKVIASITHGQGGGAS